MSTFWAAATAGSIHNPAIIRALNFNKLYLILLIMFTLPRAVQTLLLPAQKPQLPNLSGH
jgi:hypothetical protein